MYAPCCLLCGNQGWRRCSGSTSTELSMPPTPSRCKLFHRCWIAGWSIRCFPALVCNWGGATWPRSWLRGAPI